MEQVIQSLSTGKLQVAEVPSPQLREAGMLVRSHASIISIGTERMMLELARKSLLGKAKERPDLARKVLTKLRRDGFWATFRGVRQQLDREVPVGYSLCGEVLEVGVKAREFHVGQHVACAGAGYANHAELNYVPRLLAVPVPLGVSSESAAYATIGAVALQGVRNADVRVGESVAVLGLGLIGQLAVQILRGAGCRVIGLDMSQQRAELAGRHGAELAVTLRDADATQRVLDFTRGRGVDAVLIAAATSSNNPVEVAARIARDRGRVVMVGVTGMNLPRRPYFEKELTFIVSRSYGPGRYDREYEEHGHDYPSGQVRWTEQRNLEAFLDLVAAGAVKPETLTTHRFVIDDADKAFELILGSREPCLGVVLTYPHGPERELAASTRIAMKSPRKRTASQTGVSFLGAGNFARGVLLPALSRLKSVQFQGVVTSSGVSARSAAEKFGFAYCASTPQAVFEDEGTDAVFIVTRHSQHAGLACQALLAGKTVFVEKPLAVNLRQLRMVRRVLEQGTPGLMVGFNRRFAPLAEELKAHVSGRGPLTIHYRCNAGSVPLEHWLTDPEEGGRLIGEACHFFDFFAFLTEAEPRRVYAACPGAQTSVDEAHVTVTYGDGSVAHLLYTAQGPASFGKERMEVYGGGNVGVLEDFRTLLLESDGNRRKRRRLMRADKGHAAALRAFLDALAAGRPMPISPETLLATTSVSLAAILSLQRNEVVDLQDLADSPGE